MLTCAYKYQAYSFAPGDATISRQAAGQVALYLAAATKATDASFIGREATAMKRKALDAAVAEFAAIKGGNEGLLAAWAAVKEQCDQKLAARQREPKAIIGMALSSLDAAFSFVQAARGYAGSDRPATTQAAV